MDDAWMKGCPTWCWSRISKGFKSCYDTRLDPCYPNSLHPFIWIQLPCQCNPIQPCNHMLMYQYAHVTPPPHTHTHSLPSLLLPYHAYLHGFMPTTSPGFLPSYMLTMCTCGPPLFHVWYLFLFVKCLFWEEIFDMWPFFVRFFVFSNMIVEKWHGDDRPQQVFRYL